MPELFHRKLERSAIGFVLAIIPRLRASAVSLR